MAEPVLQAAHEHGALEKFLQRESNAGSAVIHAVTPLSGGAVQESWKIDAEFSGGSLSGRQALVLRTDAPTALAASLSRAAEYAVLRAAFDAGALAPEPLYCCADRSVLGRPFFIMRWVPGSTSGAALVHDGNGAQKSKTVANDLARELARIHAIEPPRADLATLGDPPTDPAEARIEVYGQWLGAFEDPHPVAEWALRWLEREKPFPSPPVLCHGDFRTGNYLTDERRLTAILDWEFAAWGDSHEDIGWFCCKSWRFGSFDREAGGLVPREVFYRAYEEFSGRTLDARRLYYWEIMANLRWLLLALQQRDRLLRCGERSLALALTGRRPAECEFELLRLIEAGRL